MTETRTPIAAGARYRVRSRINGSLHAVGKLVVAVGPCEMLPHLWTFRFESGAEWPLRPEDVEPLA